MLLNSACTTITDDDLSYHKSQRLHSKLLSILRMMFTSPRTRATSNLLADVDHPSLSHPNLSPNPFCIFCGASKENGFNVVWEDDLYTVFTDINPSAEYHLQIIPKRHIESVKMLLPSDAPMVKEMVEIGHKILDSFDTPPHLRRLGFHIPPYISVPHLHMHVQALPYRSLLRRLKYPVVTGRKGYEKGFSWFADAEQTTRLLEKGVQTWSSKPPDPCMFTVGPPPWIPSHTNASCIMWIGETSLPPERSFPWLSHWIDAAALVKFHHPPAALSLLWQCRPPPVRRACFRGQEYLRASGASFVLTAL